MSEHNLVFGKHAVMEALRSGVPVRRVLIADNIEHDRAIEGIERAAQESGVLVTRVPRKKLEGFCESSRQVPHQGVVAETEQYCYAELSSIIDAANSFAETCGGCALVVVCDHITDAGNLGAIVRSAESAGACGVIIPNRRSAQVTPITYKTSAGAVAHMRVAQVPNLKRALEDLKHAGFWVVGATEHASEMVWGSDLEGRIVLVLGNEHDGLSELTLKTCDLTCKLPQVGEVSSLNVAQASTVFMYEWLRQNIDAGNIDPAMCGGNAAVLPAEVSAD